MSDSRLGWGVMGTGNIAGQFAEGVAASRRGRLAAVASRTRDSAEAFATKYAVPSVHEGYERLLSDASVDAVYVSLPNTMHHDWTVRALQAGKHVLCEKPIAANAAEAEAMFDAAAAAGRVLVEAFMYRSHPQTAAILRRVRDGEIGPLKLIDTSFCFRVRKTEGNIRFDPDLAGGALMDVGCYCVNFSRLLAGCEPEAMHAVARLHESGVDEQTSVVMRFPTGVTATFTCGLGLQADNTAHVCGEEGYLTIGWPWKPPAGSAKFTLDRAIPPRQDNPDGMPTRPPRETIEVNAPGPLYALEADDFAATVLDNAPPTLTRDDSVGNLRVLDELRRQIGLKY